MLVPNRANVHKIVHVELTEKRNRILNGTRWLVYSSLNTHDTFIHAYLKKIIRILSGVHNYFNL